MNERNTNGECIPCKRAYYALNADRLLVQAQAWYAANKEQALAQQKRYKLANPDKVRSWRAKRRANKAAVPTEPYTRQDIIDRDGLDCGLCGEPVDLKLKHPDPASPSIDHVLPISLDGPDILANVQLAHLRCNIRKSNRVDSTIFDLATRTQLADAVVI
jgi:hypothetical protein